VNDTSTHEFKPGKSLKKEDPMSPFMFLIIVEGLADMVRQVNKKELLEGIVVGKNNVEVGLLQFVDDTLFLCQARYQDIVVKSILRGFELVSGLIINFHKSSIRAIGIRNVKLQNLSTILNSNHMHIPLKYLRMSVGGNPRKVQFWDTVLSDIINKL